MATSMNGSGGYAPPGKKWEGDIRPSGYRTAQMSNFTPEQGGLFKQGMENVGPDSYLSKLAGGDQSAFAEMEAPAMRQFGELQGNLSSRFSGMGMGARKSSGFSNTMNAAASDFAQDLQSKRMNIRNDAIKSLHGMSQDLLNQRPFERQMYKKEQNSGFNWGQAASGAVKGGIQGFMAGGPWGAAAGATAGGVSGGYGGGGEQQGGGMDYSSLSGMKNWGNSGGQPSPYNS